MKSTSKNLDQSIKLCIKFTLKLMTGSYAMICDEYYLANSYYSFVHSLCISVCVCVCVYMCVGAQIVLH